MLSIDYRGMLFVGAGLALLVAVGILLVVWRESRDGGFRPGLGREARVVGSDTGVAPPVLLSDPMLGLRGRPDYLLSDGPPGERQYIPLEVKPIRRSRRLYETDEVQLGAYLIASRATFGEQAAPFGYVQYATDSFRVQLTPQLEQRVREIVASLRAGRSAPVVRRTHAIRARCARCAMREHCDEALA